MSGSIRGATDAEKAHRMEALDRERDPLCRRMIAITKEIALAAIVRRDKPALT